MLDNKDYREPFKGFYVRLPCNQQLVHEDKVAALSLSIDRGEKKQEKLLYICPVCDMQHISLLEG